jgi:hypothetical protein
MQFNIQTWRKRYDEIQNLGQIIKNSLPNKEGTRPVTPISHETRMSLEKDIEERCKKVSEYLEASNMQMPSPLWHFDIKDESTWLSSEHFAYGHLVR